MFTAAHARDHDRRDLDTRIKNAVTGRRKGQGAYMRVYHDDPWRYSIQSDLEERGFTNVEVPDIVICGNVYFEWTSEEQS